MTSPLHFIMGMRITISGAVCINNTYHNLRRYLKEQSLICFNTNCTLNINLLDKYIEQVGENKKLYQVLLKEKDEKIALLEKTIGKK